MKTLGPAPLGKWPLLWPTIGAVTGLLCASAEWWAPLVGLVVVALYQGLHSQRPVWIVAATMSLLFACLHNHELKTISTAERHLAKPTSTSLTGTLIESNSSSLVRRLLRTSEGARINLIGLAPNFQTGQRITVIGRPVAREPARNPGGFDIETTLARRGIAGTVQVEAALSLGWGSPFAILRGWSESLRADLARRVTEGIDDRASADIVQAVVLGEKAAGSTAFEDFRKTGTMHIFAVSGLHVGLVALIVGVTGKLLRWHPRAVLWCVLFSMLGYAFLTGMRPPALRAALMGCVFLGRYLFRRPSSVVNNLLAAAIVVLACDTFQLWQAGFQLSFLVVAVILALEPHLWGKVAHLAEQDPYLPKAVWNRWQHFSTGLRTKLGRMFTVSLAAWVGSSPLSICYFGWFTPISSLASVLMVMAAFVILLLSLLSLAIAPLSAKTSHWANSLNGHLAGRARIAAASMAEIPGGWHRLHDAAPWENGLCVFDLPHAGAAIHLDRAGGVLIDAGNNFTYWREVYPALESFQVSCDSAIATHADADHVGGLRSAFTAFPIRQVLLPASDRSHSLDTVATAAQERGVRLHDAGQLTSLPLDPESRIEILFAGDPTAGQADDRGLVLMLHCHQWRILMTADAGYATEMALLTSGADLRADVWICGRHQGNLMGTDAFVKAVSPRAIIATDQAYPVTEQVPESWRRWLESRGTTFISQREHGAVFVVPERDRLLLSSFLGGKITTLAD